MVKIDSGEVLEMRDERFQDLLDEITKKYNQTRLSVLMGGGFAALAPLLAFAAPLPATLTASGASLVAYVLGRWLDSYRRSAIMFYNFEDKVASNYSRFVESFGRLAACNKFGTYHQVALYVT
jgi:hypothetical protein